MDLASGYSDSINYGNGYTPLANNAIANNNADYLRNQATMALLAQQAQNNVFASGGGFGQQTADYAGAGAAYSRAVQPQMADNIHGVNGDTWARMSPSDRATFNGQMGGGGQPTPTPNNAATDFSSQSRGNVFDTGAEPFNNYGVPQGETPTQAYYRLMGYGGGGGAAQPQPQPQAETPTQAYYRLMGYGGGGGGGGGGSDNPYASQPWWNTFAAAAGPQGVSDWLQSKGISSGGGGGAQAQPQPQPQPAAAQTSMWGGPAGESATQAYYRMMGYGNMGGGSGLGQPTGLGGSGFGGGAGGYVASNPWGYAQAPAPDISRPASYWTANNDPSPWKDTRATYTSQLSQDPARMYDMAVRLYLEANNDSQGRQGIAEAMFNRNAARGLDPLDKGYYPKGSDYLDKYANATRDLRNNPELLGQIYGEVGRAAGGSNISQGATDWASAGTASEAARNATETWKSPVEGERFFRRDLLGTDTGDGAARQIQDWYRGIQNWQAPQLQPQQPVWQPSS